MFHDGVKYVIVVGGKYVERASNSNLSTGETLDKALKFSLATSAARYMAYWEKERFEVKGRPVLVEDLSIHRATWVDQGEV